MPDTRRTGSSQRGAAPASRWQSLSRSLLVYRGAPQGSGQAWLLTFTDLSALMLTFFVLLFSMSTIETQQWQNLIDALSPRMVNLQEVTVALPSSDQALDEVERVPGTDLDYLAAVLKDAVAADELLAQALIQRRADSLVISLPGDLLFAPGATELGSAGEKAVYALVSVLRHLRNVIEIAGHADPSQPHGIYPTNWELSLARAAALSGMLNKAGYEGEVVVRGYGDARYQEAEDGSDVDGQMARARRVDVVVHAFAGEVR
jgi:chemotaxis protein MotB